MKWLICISLLSCAMLAQAQEVYKKDKKRGKWGFVDAQGQVLIDYQFDEAESFSEELAAVKRKGQWGFIDKQGNTVIPFQYEEVESFRNPSTAVKMKGKYGLIDRQGTFLAEPVYDTMAVMSKAVLFRTPEGLGLLDLEGENITGPEFSRIELGQEGSLNLKKEEGQWYKFDDSGLQPAALSSLVFYLPDEMPRYTGCEGMGFSETELKKCSDEKMLMHLYNKLHYPALARKNGVEGMVVIAFVIDADGRASGFEVVRDVGAGLGNEAKRVVETMTDWVPGKIEGTPVATMFKLPVKFKLE